MGQFTARGLTLVGGSIKALFINVPPTWVTATGSLGSLYDYETITSGGFIVQAIDPDSFPVAVMYDIIAGSLPTGATLDSNTGTITGPAVPVASDTVFTFTVRASDGDVQITREFSITVLDNIAPTWSTPSGTLGSRHESETITSGGFQVTATDADGGPSTISYSVFSGSLPTGASLNSSTGEITGPTVSVGSDTTYNFTIRASDGDKNTDRAFSITVDNNLAPVWTTSNASPIADVNIGDSVSTTVTATDADSLPMSLTYSIVSGALPDGLSLNPSTGDITGTTTTAGSFLFTVEASDGLDGTSRQFEIDVHQVALVIDNSLVFNDGNTEYLNWTPSAASDNDDIATFSGWVKLGDLAIDGYIISCGNAGANHWDIRYTNNQLNFFNVLSSLQHMNLTPSMLLRDPAAWYHIFFVYDSTQATASDRAKVWINGIQVTNFDTETYPSLNDNIQLCAQSQIQRIGRRSYDATRYWDGYMAEIHVLNGIAGDVNDFGFFDDDGVWQPIEYTGLHGTNGFYLDFENSGDLGADVSGNGNDFSLVNLTSNSQTTDTPTYNYPVYNSINESGSITNYIDGNLQVQGTGSGHIHSTMAFPSTGKWYFEFTVIKLPTESVSGATDGFFGVTNETDTNLIGYRQRSGMGSGTWISTDIGVNLATASTITNNDVIGVAVNRDDNEVSFYLNGVLINGTAYSYVADEPIFAFSTSDSGGGGARDSNTIINFGQKAFAFTAPVGYSNLNSDNLPTPTITDGSLYFNTVLYNGDGTSSHPITGIGFQPDFTIIKSRSHATSNYMYDVLRGASKRLVTESAFVEATIDGLNSFNSDGFTLGTEIGNNGSGRTFVSWNWKANGSGTSNTDGSISSTVSVNATSGFSIVTYSSGISGQKTVGHGLGVTPDLIITKARNSATFNWAVYHKDAVTTTSEFLRLNTSDSLITFSTIWGAALPTSSVFGITSGGGVATSSNCIAYCFAEIEGYSKFGTYVGNGSSDGPFVYTGFRPRYVVIKNVDSTGSWAIKDTARDTYNVTDNTLYMNDLGVELVDETLREIDILSNGFKIRDNVNTVNTASDNYIYIAFAEHPFKSARAR